jgi:hypothetical protein
MGWVAEARALDIALDGPSDIGRHQRCLKAFEKENGALRRRFQFIL